MTLVASGLPSWGLMKFLIPTPVAPFHVGASEEAFWKPFAAMNLVWNSLLSMSGGWFFLSVCEAFTLGDREYRLPGVGAYMATAIGFTHQ